MSGAAAASGEQKAEEVAAPTVPGARLSLQQIEHSMASGLLTSRALCEYYLRRIHRLDWAGPQLRSVIEVNPEALAIADGLDKERRENGVGRGPLHGVPVLLKDNIDTADLLHTTAGSLALMSSKVPQDALVASKLREAGAVILGKANLSEWANYRSTNSISGWSARGGQCKNPYALDRSPGGSSSGSAAAVAADLCAVSLGTETDGSIVNPANNCGVVGIKPTVGLTSRAGVVPIAESQDTVGPFGRCIRDAALVLTAISGAVDPRDPKTDCHANRRETKTDYAAACDPETGLQGARIGIPKKCKPYWGYAGAESDELCEQAVAKLEAAGAVLVREVDLPGRDSLKLEDGTGEGEVLKHEFRLGVHAYLATRVEDPLPGGGDRADLRGAAAVPRSLADLVEFNALHADKEMPLFGQELWKQALELADKVDNVKGKQIQEGIAEIARRELDKALQESSLDALVCPSCGPAPIYAEEKVNPEPKGDSFGLAAVAGYPVISMPCGLVPSTGAPVSISFVGTSFSEAKLIRLASAFERQIAPPLPPPQFNPKRHRSA